MARTALVHSLVRSGMPIPGCMVRRFLRAPELRTIGLVCQSRPVPGAVRRISRSEPTGCDGRHAGREKRTVLATPRHCEDRHADARSRRSWVWGSAWDRGPDARERRLALSLLPCEPESSAGRNDSIRYRSESTYRLTRFLQVPRNRSAQFPEGAGSSRPLVSLTSGAGGASSPAMDGVISAGTEAMVAAGFAAWYVCWPAP